MKKLLIVGLLSVGLIAVMVTLVQKGVGAVTCPTNYTHGTKLVYGIEKHTCTVQSTSRSVTYDWGLWGISKKAVRQGIGLRAQYFGTEDSGDGSLCNPTAEDPTDPDCLIRGIAFCCNGGGQCGGQGQPFNSQTQSAVGRLVPGSCDSTGKCREILVLDIDESELICPNSNWSVTFFPEEMYAESCTCDGTFDTFGNCSGSSDCDVELCSVDLSGGFRPGDIRNYTCEHVLGEDH